MREFLELLLVSGQFVSIGLLLWSTRWRYFSWGSALFFAASLLLALWSFWAMRPGSFNIRPVLKKGAKLVCSGPYRYIRNPMYLSVILACGGLLLINCSWWRGLVFLSLVSILIGKICLEEHHLRHCFPTYDQYYACTGRILPRWRGPRP